VKIITKNSFVIFILFIGTACDGLQNKNKEVPIVKVYDKSLYKSDIAETVPEGVRRQDSFQLSKQYIYQWIKNQLLLRKAELNLTDEEKDVSQEIEDYRTSLLIYKYKDKLIKHKLDTALSRSEILSYYSNNKINFKLQNTIVKAYYVKVPHVYSGIDKLKYWCDTTNTEKIKKLNSYCRQYAIEYIPNDRWIEIAEINNFLKKETHDLPHNIRKGQIIESKDESFYYLLYIIDKRDKNEIAPLKYVENRIKNILINKNKNKFLRNLEEQIYSNAMNNGNIKFYE
jgi:hypothetical protein